MKKMFGRLFLLGLAVALVCAFTGCSTTGSPAAVSAPEASGPKTAEDYRERAISYYNQKDYQNALLDFDKVIQLDPTSARAYTNRGVVLDALKDDRNALIAYDKAIELDPTYISAYLNRGVLYYENRQYSNALNDYNKAIELDPTYVRAYLNRGVLYYETGKTKEDLNKAIKEFEKILEINPSDPVTSEQNLYYRIGLCYRKMQDFENARLYANKSLEIDSGYKAALDFLADLYDPSQFAIVPADFKPSEYTKADLFTAVAASEKLELTAANIFGQYYTPSENFVSEVVFVSQNGTDITFRTDDNAISKRMKVDSRTGLSASQRVRIYYTAYRLNDFQIIAIERL